MVSTWEDKDVSNLEVKELIVQWWTNKMTNENAGKHNTLSGQEQIPWSFCLSMFVQDQDNKTGQIARAEQQHLHTKLCMLISSHSQPKQFEPRHN